MLKRRTWRSTGGDTLRSTGGIPKGIPEGVPGGVPEGVPGGVSEGYPGGPPWAQGGLGPSPSGAQGAYTGGSSKIKTRNYTLLVVSSDLERVPRVVPHFKSMYLAYLNLRYSIGRFLTDPVK